ncbi:MAG: ATP-binding cassette domain-containing protein, partial [bacterium]|nr:ATP-binding cassette domain-containing protein [bacterium]
MADLVRFEAVSKSYGEVRALKDVTFSIVEGEILGYVGPNGAGKTTTIKTMTGVLKHFAGRLSVAGHALPREAEAVSKVLGYLPQNVAFHDWRTTYQALRIFGRLSDMEGAALEERIDEVL